MFLKRVRTQVTDELRGRTADGLLEFYDDRYFVGRRDGEVFGYYDYAEVRWVLDGWSEMLEERFGPDSVLDVGAAYGFVVEFFRARGRRADGVEPSPFARAEAAVDLVEGSLPDALPVGPAAYELVACTEVLEHVRPEDVPRALDALVARAHRWVVCLVEMGEWDAYHEDPSHIHLRPRAWWVRSAEGVAGAMLDHETIAWLDAHPLSRRMGWTGRFLVLRVDDASSGRDGGGTSG